MGTHPDQRVTALISASGPLRAADRIHRAPERLQLAERLVAEGRGRELLPPDEGGRITSAQTLVARTRAGMDVYGVDREDAPVSRITCPMLFVLGSEEPDIGTEADLPLLRRNAKASRGVQTLYVPGADHLYTKHELEVADGIGDWLDGLG